MRNILFTFASLIGQAVLAQTAPSDSLFSTDQVVTVDLDFGDDDFWSLLTSYYENDAGETLTGDVTITDLTGTYQFYNVEVDLKGNSSYSHPGNKKSFKIDFNDNIQGQKYHGMAKMHLNNCWSDPTFLREKVFFDYCREQGVLAPRVLYANVSMNGTFWGFYNLVEAVDKDFLDRWVDDDNGNLFKASDNFGMGGGGGGSSSEADLAYYGTDASAYGARYELKTNENENDWTDLIELIEVINNRTDAELVTELPARIVLDDVLRSLALDNLFGNLDTYINSARNYYLYHDSTTFQWNWIKWDANMAFGSYPAGGQNALILSPVYVAGNRPLMTRIMNVEALRTRYLNAYCAVKTNFTNVHLDARIDEIAALIEPHVAADVNKQYTLAQFNENIVSDITVTGGGPGGSQTLFGLKSFISTRNANLDGVLDCVDAGLPSPTEGSGLIVFPDPAVDQLNINLAGGTTVRSAYALDALGRRSALNYAAERVHVAHLAGGTYVLVLETVQGPVSTRFVKQ